MLHSTAQVPTLVDRRSFLRAGSIAYLGLQLPALLQCQAHAAGNRKAKSCILLYMTGGPAQHETFDPKPDAPTGMRGEFKPIATSVPGIQICELLPYLAKQAHRYTILRSTYHNENEHGAAVHLNLTGVRSLPRSGSPAVDRRDAPSLSGVVRQLHGDRNGLPGSVHLPARIGDQNVYQWAGQHAGMLGARYDPLMLIDEKWLPGTLPPAFLPDPAVGMERQFGRGELLQKLERPDAGSGAAARNYQVHRERALSVLQAQSAWDAFLFKGEKPSVIERYGNSKFGRSCLVARRLIEAGVGLVTVTWMTDPNVKFNSESNFDTHINHFAKMKNLLLPAVDRAAAALLEDLDERGLLGETLVVWTGEFGRTPKITGTGRDHWGRVYSTFLAGGGVGGGRAWGASDKTGGEPVDRPVHIADLVSTIYSVLGYQSSDVVYTPDGRPHMFMPGKSVQGLM